MSEWTTDGLPAIVQEYLRDLTERVVSVFEERTVGVWLIGSAAYGGYTENSDLDVQAAVAGPTDSEVAALVEMINHEALPCPAAGLEFVLYARDVLVDPVAPLQWSLNLNGGPKRSPSLSTDFTSEEWFWFVLDLAVVRDLSVALHGQDLVDVVGMFSRDVQIAAIADSVRWHAAHVPDGPSRGANAARGLRFIETGTWGSKPEGLAWLASTGRTPEQALHLVEALPTLPPHSNP
ncbi:hypothetical protein MNBD_ACTINO02-202 [hydrothermal vent metagenome]|uniref:Polymerase nucleotidyl transferase domain-containing protein n=1 Tax=hydrothermal vent metagenome TaxID=652676 RepID=A0A3B0SGB7_9ZZZZ